jgi:septal ring factor EnvC (AmiA/AmiB activator)
MEGGMDFVYSDLGGTWLECVKCHARSPLANDADHALQLYSERNDHIDCERCTELDRELEETQDALDKATKELKKLKKELKK